MLARDAQEQGPLNQLTVPPKTTMKKPTSQPEKEIEIDGIVYIFCCMPVLLAVVLNMGTSGMEEAGHNLQHERARPEDHVGAHHTKRDGQQSMSWSGVNHTKRRAGGQLLMTQVHEAEEGIECNI